MHVRPNRWQRLAATSILAITAMARADESAILKEIESFFATTDTVARQQIAQRIESDRAWDPEQLPAWLHRAGLFKPLETGHIQIVASIDGNYTLPITIRVPAGYDCARPYPLIYALHGTGGSAASIIGYVEHVLGDDVEHFIIAAPTGYRQALVRSTTPPSREHMIALADIKRQVHVNSDRVYALGYSRGGHTAWSLAVLHPDEFAGVAPIAGTLLLFEYGRLFETFVPNLAATHVFACWGAGDVMSADLATRSADGGIAGLNRKLCSLAASLKLPVRWYEDPDKGHGGIVPPRKELDALLSSTREQSPRTIHHVFRLPYQGRTAWIEAHAWRGSWWDEKPLKLAFRRGENPNDPDAQHEAAARAVRSRLGELRGEVNGQEIKVYRKKVTELTVWIPNGLIDWDQPIRLRVNGRKAFADALKPDLLVALSQAERTYDFDRLRWAGLRFKSGSKTRPVTGSTPFPESTAIPH